MIIKAFIKIQAFLPKKSFDNLLSLHVQYFCHSKQLSTQLRVDLVEKLTSMNIKTKKSILIQQPSQQTDSTSHKLGRNKNSFRKLTIPQKVQLGILVPHAPFNLRMTKKCQQQYRQAICQNLYQAQRDNLDQSIRILQLQTSKTNIDEYINSIYKDIFSRYMISRGYGVQWQAYNSSYGVMNPSQQTKVPKQRQIRQFYAWIGQLMKQYPLFKKQVISLYSYSSKKFIKIEDVEVENMFKIGHYFKIQLTKFGRFHDSFQVLLQRKQKIQLLFMVQDPIKLLNMQAICIQPNKKMIILSKYQQQPTQQQQLVQSKINSFLITSMDVYTDHLQYFTSNGYKKHLIFDSSHLLEMQVQNGVKIYNDIPNYSRKGGAYVIDRLSGLPDFQRAVQLELNTSKYNRYLDQQGKIKRLSQNIKEAIYITDLHYQQKIIQNLQSCGVKAKKIDLFSTYQDQVFSYKEQKLHFRITEKYSIPIPQQNHSQIQQALNKSIISQSKVIIPKLKLQYSKPRDKRRHIKQIRMLKQQETQYMSLRDCLQTYDSLSFSTNIGGGYQFPVFLSEVQFNGQVVNQQIQINQRIKNLVSESAIIKQGNNNQTIVKWDHKKLQQFLASINNTLAQQNKNRKTSIKFLNLSQNLYKGYLCFKNYSQKSQLSNIVIQPQSKTEDVVPYFFHLHYLLHKMQSKRNIKQRGRRTKNINRSENKIFSLIKFHPTIDQSQRKKSINEILFGIVKANNQQQYGYGLEALRIWVARKDNYLGQRILKDQQVNKQLHISSFIRKLYWQILPIMNIDLNKIIIENSQNQIQLIPGSNKSVPRQKLSYLHNFIMDHIDYYILNMEECYNKLDLSKAIQLTQDFFKNYINQIFVKTVRKRIIAYPFNQQNQQHIYVLRRIIDLLGVVAPILPYSAYHISKSQLIQWPQVKKQQVRTELIPNYNRMTKLRVQVRNKFAINNFHHSELVIPIDKNSVESNSKEKIPDMWRLSKEDLQLFFDIENISIQQPTQQGKSCHLKLKQNHPLGKIPKIKFYEYKEVCIRCSPYHNYGTHLCPKCLQYLNSNFGKKLPLIT